MEEGKSSKKDLELALATYSLKLFSPENARKFINLEKVVDSANRFNQIAVLAMQIQSAAAEGKLDLVEKYSLEIDKLNNIKRKKE